MDLKGNVRAQDALDRMQTAREKRDAISEQLAAYKQSLMEQRDAVGIGRAVKSLADILALAFVIEEELFK